MLPWLYGGTVAVVLALVILKADLTKDWARWLQATVTLSVGVAVAAAVQTLLVPRLHARLLTSGLSGEVTLALLLYASHLCPVLSSSSFCQALAMMFFMQT